MDKEIPSRDKKLRMLSNIPFNIKVNTHASLDFTMKGIEMVAKG